MDEEWRTIDKAPAYEVSNLGRIRHTVYLDGYIDDYGYRAVQLFADGKRCGTYRVHKLVADLFLPNPDGLPEVDHINGNKLDSAAKNLEWVTRMENQRRMIRLGSRNTAKGETSGVSKLTEAQVIEIRSLAGHINQRDIAKRFGVTQFCVSAIVRRKTWAHLAADPENKPLRKRSETTFKKGSQHPRAKLTEDRISEIRALRDVLPPREIAQRFKMSQSAIRMILLGRTWTHVR